MSEFQELIKNFERIRDYMRQFYIYGFKTRTDFDTKSARTYDNERRRMESWLSDYTKSTYTPSGKQVYISVDSQTIKQNPLYAAWKAKSFTDNDILLHFFLLNLLTEHGYCSSAQLADALSKQYGLIFENQTVRLKLKEYESMGILTSKKDGRTLLYKLLPSANTLHPDSSYSKALSSFIKAIEYYQEAAPFGFIGSTLLDVEHKTNQHFQFKHHFIVHTLEDNILLTLLQAIKAHCFIQFQNKSSRSGNISETTGVPLKIMVSTQTGRRYICLYQSKYQRSRFICLRLDCISQVKLLEPCKQYREYQQALTKNLPLCWGVSFNGTQRKEEIYLKLFIDEETEIYMIDRLKREAHNGEILKISKNTFLYSGVFFDTNEMLPWIKTFTGRILDIQGSNDYAIQKLTADLALLYQMYCTT